MNRTAVIIGKVLLAILSVILCILLFVSTLVTMLVADVKVATNKDNLQKVISATLSQPVRRTGILQAAAASDVPAAASTNSGLTGQLIDLAYDMLTEQSGGELPFTKEEITQFVEESTVKDFIADKSASIISDIYSGENTTSITAEDISTLLTENKELIQEYFNVQLDDETISALTESIVEMPAVKQINEEGIASIIMGSSNDESSFDSSLGSGSSTSTTTNSMTDMLDMVRTFTSDAVLLGCVGACAVLVGLLFLCAWSKPHFAMFYSGSTFTLAGIIFLVPTLIAWLAPATWMGLFSNIPDMGAMIGSVGRIVLMLTGSVCGIVTGLGAALIAGGIFVCKALRKCKAAKLAAAVVEEAPAEEPAAEEAPAEEPAAEEAPAEEPAAEEAPAEEPAAEEAPAEETV